MAKAQGYSGQGSANGFQDGGTTATGATGFGNGGRAGGEGLALVLGLPLLPQVQHLLAQHVGAAQVGPHSHVHHLLQHLPRLPPLRPLLLRHLYPPRQRWVSEELLCRCYDS